MRDLSFTAEHIFYLEVNQLYKTLRPYVEQYKINADFSSTDNEKVFYTTKTKGESLYEIADGTGVSDIRYMRWFNKTEAKAWTFLKFYERQIQNPGQKTRCLDVANGECTIMRRSAITT